MKIKYLHHWNKKLNSWDTHQIEHKEFWGIHSECTMGGKKCKDCE